MNFCTVCDNPARAMPQKAEKWRLFNAPEIRNMRPTDIPPWCRLERAAGIEPASLAWKAKVLPLHNARDADLSSDRARPAQEGLAIGKLQVSGDPHTATAGQPG